MIVVRLTDGLGNQMFQYAFGFALSRIHGVDLYYDTRWYDVSHYTKDPYRRRLGLTSFNLSAKPWPSSKDGYFGLTNNRLSKLFFSIKRILGNTSILTEQGLDFDIGYQEKSKKNAYLFGYWQSNQYFKEFDKELRCQFEFPITALVNNFPEPIVLGSTQNTVCVHVRRGDYFASEVIRQQFGLLDEDYFRKAIDRLKSDILNPEFIFFSDDIEWCKTKFADITGATFAEHLPGMPDWYDMYRMSLCKHFIISNSTYSWWASWLSKNENKKVIVPEKWHMLKTDSQSMHPSNWYL